MEQATQKFTPGKRWADKYAFDKSDPATRMFVACSNWMDRAEQAESALRAIESALDGERNRFGKLEHYTVRDSEPLRLLAVKYGVPGCRDTIEQAVFVARAALAKAAP